ncbi:hypothetical protein O6H91_11G049900 [Diphasiastrum complanatum]|uniref:Uncharacterized protein n=1 Tax=Diphasiastrum complanatum TaxID=34168 RepID=A0ACC2C8X7_DIPCM|nr:hypothetical protein O6H91_11G049900 [Diphasiastrum complanatum]
MTHHNKSRCKGNIFLVREKAKSCVYYYIIIIAYITRRRWLHTKSAEVLQLFPTSSMPMATSSRWNAPSYLLLLKPLSTSFSYQQHQQQRTLPPRLRFYPTFFSLKSTAQAADAPARSLSSRASFGAVSSFRKLFGNSASKMKVQRDPSDLENDELKEPLTTVGEQIADKSFSWTSVILPFLFPALGGVLFGYDIGATSGASISLTSADLSGTDWYKLTPIETGLVVSGSLYGALFGSILAFNIGDSLGRRRELILAAIIYSIGSLFTALAPNFSLLMTGRLIFGLGIGLAMHGAPMYIAETSPAQIRGTLVSLKEAFIVGGILLGYLAGSLEIGAIGGWRWMYGFSTPIALVMGIGMWWLPPSPRWLLLQAVQGKGDLLSLKESAATAIKRLRGYRGNEITVEAQVDDTIRSLQSMQDGREDNVSFLELFQGKNLRALTVGAGLVFFQQVTGQPSVLYYAAPILQSAGFPAAADATRVSVIIGFVKLLMTTVAVLNVDKVGRRPLLIGGVTGMVVSLFSLAAYYSFGKSLPVLAVVALLMYVGCYQVSFGPISWLMISEIFPLRTRGRALSVSTLVNFASNAVVALSFAPIQELLGTPFTFVAFGAIGVGALLFIILTVPETKGLSLEEIESKFFKV